MFFFFFLFLIKPKCKWVKMIIICFNRRCMKLSLNAVADQYIMNNLRASSKELTDLLLVLQPQMKNWVKSSVRVFIWKSRGQAPDLWSWLNFPVGIFSSLENRGNQRTIRSINSALSIKLYMYHLKCSFLHNTISDFFNICYFLK